MRREEDPSNRRQHGSDVLEDPTKLAVVRRVGNNLDLDLILRLLAENLVVLVRGVSPDDADTAIQRIADQCGLRRDLEVQAAFASIRGHRQNLGRYYMTVNKRSDYQFIPPHSEGSSFTNFQLASFFCYENTTDGGETIFMQIKESSRVWESLRERRVRGRIGRASATRGEIARARIMYGLDILDDRLREDDQVLSERETKIPGLRVLDVLARPQKTYSRLLERSSYAYWDSIASVDFDSAGEYLRILKQGGLLKEPPRGLDIEQLDNAAPRRIWHSGVKYEELFASKITYKLRPADFVIHNNLTWTHSASNWTPGSGSRKVSAAFA